MGSWKSLLVFLLFRLFPLNPYAPLHIHVKACCCACSFCSLFAVPSIHCWNWLWSELVISQRSGVFQSVLEDSWDALSVSNSSYFRSTGLLEFRNTVFHKFKEVLGHIPFTIAPCLCSLSLFYLCLPEHIQCLFDAVWGAEEMARWLREYTMPAEYLSVFPNTHVRQFTNTHRSCSRASDTPFGVPQVSHTHVHKPTTNIHTHITKNNIYLLKDEF